MLKSDVNRFDLTCGKYAAGPVDVMAK